MINEKHKDVVIVGFGWVGAIMARELTQAGLSVVALERGPMRDTWPDGAYPSSIDELTHNSRHLLFQNLSKTTVTVRRTIDETALPYRQLAAFLPGTGVGGAGLHWSGCHWRVTPEDLRLRSYYEERYGKNFIPKEMTIQDWGVTYEELEPHFAFAEQVFGTSGQAYKVNGQIVGDGNPFDADRSTAFPLPPMQNTYSASLFGKAAASCGYHPFSIPSANASQAYTNPYGCQMGACTFCGFCSGYACYNYSKASPNVNILPALRFEPLFEIRAECDVLRVETDSAGTKATGVVYLNSKQEEVRQTADIVIVATFAFNNAHLLLVSGIGNAYDPVTGQGTLGRNFVYQNESGVTAFFDKNTYTDPFIGAGGNGVAIDDFNAGHFDHGPLGFVGGAPIWVNQAGSKPITGMHLPEGSPKWGTGWKAATKAGYRHNIAVHAHGTNMAYRDCYLSLDPTYKDYAGRPLLRMTFNWHENDIRMIRYVTGKMEGIVKAMNPSSITVETKKPGEQFDVRSYQTTHLAGGVAMGTSPKDSVVNRYLQHWQVPNLFVIGSSAFPQGIGYNPTGVVAALAYWSAKAIREQYLKAPGPMVQA